MRISEIYKSIQGESSLVGLPTTFVRLMHCNLRCAWCDSMYAVEGNDWKNVSVEDVASRILDLETDYVCWTGGEPLLQWREVATVIKMLPHLTHSIETDGEIDLADFDAAISAERELQSVKYVMDVKCPDSKMKANVAIKNLAMLQDFDEMKFVLASRKDYEFAKDFIEKYTILVESSHILFSYVNAVPGRYEGGLEPKTLAAWILEDGLTVRFQPQIHRFIWPTKERGI